MSVHAAARNLRTFHKAIGTTATKLVADADVDGDVRNLLVVAVKIRNLVASTDEVYVSNSDAVTASGATGGDEVAPGESVVYDLNTGGVDKLYDIAASGTQNVAVTLLVRE